MLWIAEERPDNRARGRRESSHEHEPPVYPLHGRVLCLLSLDELEDGRDDERAEDHPNEERRVRLEKRHADPFSGIFSFLLDEKTF